MAPAPVPSAAAGHRPAVLLVNENEWSGRVLETVLEPAGYRVARSASHHDALRLVRTRGLDAVIVDAELSNGGASYTCRELREIPQLGRRTPLFVSFRDRASRVERREAVRAGAWHLLEPPVDPEFLLLHLKVYVEARREAEQFRDAMLLNEATGLYTSRGVAHRGSELWAWAARLKMPLACVVLAPATQGKTSEDLAETVTSALRSAGRRTDAIGYTDRDEFVIIAAGTDAQGTERMAERLMAAAGVEPSRFLRAGYEVIAPLLGEKESITDLVAHARHASARAGGNDRWLVPYDG